MAEFNVYEVTVSHSETKDGSPYTFLQHVIARDEAGARARVGSLQPGNTIGAATVYRDCTAREIVEATAREQRERDGVTT